MVLRPELLGEFQAYAEKKTGEAKARRMHGMTRYDLQFWCSTSNNLEDQLKIN